MIHNGIKGLDLLAKALAINLYMVFKIDRGLQLVIIAKVLFLDMSDKLLKEAECPKEP